MSRLLDADENHFKEIIAGLNEIMEMLTEPDGTA